MPDLPASAEYPCYRSMGERGDRCYAYEFITQIDCAEVAHLQHFLPREGRLYFYLSTVEDLLGDVELHYPVCLVHFDESPVDQLVPCSELSFEAKDYYDLDGPCYRAETFLTPSETVLSAPSFYSIHQNESLFEPVLKSLGIDAAAFFEDGDELFDHLDATFDAFMPDDAHYLGGYGASQDEFPIVQAANARGGNPIDWQLLLTVRSRGTMHWGNTGDLHFAIHKGDLAKRDFSRVWVGMYAG